MPGGLPEPMQLLRRPVAAHVVVSSFDEDAQWALEKFQSSCIYLYNKGSSAGHRAGLREDASLPARVRYVALPNVGGDAHTYLHHVLQHYDALPEVVHFTQASRGAHEGYRAAGSVLDFEGSFVALPLEDGPERRRDSASHGGALELTDWARAFVDPLLRDEDALGPCWGGSFSVTRARLLSRPREYYERLQTQLEVDGDPPCGRHVRRLWHRIFRCHEPPSTTVVSCFYLLRRARVQRGPLTPADEREEEDRWLEGCARTCRLRHPMVIFVDEARRAQRLEALRASFGLAGLTRVVCLPFEELAMAPWLEKVRANREAYWPTRDARCEDKVHLLLLSRFDLVARVAARNPFGSSHVCQMNLSLLSKRPNNSPHYTDDAVFSKLDAILSRPRPLCTALVVQPWHPHWFHHLRAFYEFYLIQMAGAFWTADTATALALARVTKEIAEEFTAAGYGHGDEHILARAVDLTPELFTLTMGDYEDIFNNYFRPTSNLDRVRWMFEYAARLEPDGVLLQKLREGNGDA
jgi:Protein of unknown function (DUF3431)